MGYGNVKITQRPVKSVRAFRVLKVDTVKKKKKKKKLYTVTTNMFFSVRWAAVSPFFYAL